MKNYKNKKYLCYSCVYNISKECVFNYIKNKRVLSCTQFNNIGDKNDNK